MSAKANGGPVDGSAVYKAGNIVLIKQADIKLEKEELKITLDGDYSIVSVKYLLKNEAHSKIDVTYGFPIDIIREEMNYDLEWKDEYVPNIQFAANGTILPVKRQLDFSVQEFKSNNPNERHPIEFKRNWYIVDFSINKGESLSLSVDYKVKNGFTDWETSKDFFASYGNREFTYDFSPAQNWGNGIIDLLTVEVDASAVMSHNEEVTLKGLELPNTATIYANEFRNFDLKKSENLIISYRNEHEKYSEHILTSRMPLSQLKSIEVSSELKGNYSKMNLLDNDFNSAWVEGASGSGAGEKITIQLNDYLLGAICLVNGYAKNAEAYTANNRVKRVKVEREVVDLQDLNTTSIEVEELEIQDLPFANIHLDNFYSLVTIIGNYGDGYQKVRSITITILEVYPGTKYDDTCITELYLLGYHEEIDSVGADSI